MLHFYPCSLILLVTLSLQCVSCQLLQAQPHASPYGPYDYQEANFSANGLFFVRWPAGPDGPLNPDVFDSDWQQVLDAIQDQHDPTSLLVHGLHLRFTQLLQLSFNSSVHVPGDTVTSSPGNMQSFTGPIRGDVVKPGYLSDPRSPVRVPSAFATLCNATDVISQDICHLDARVNALESDSPKQDKQSASNADLLALTERVRQLETQLMSLEKSSQNMVHAILINNSVTLQGILDRLDSTCVLNDMLGEEDVLYLQSLSAGLPISIIASLNMLFRNESLDDAIEPDGMTSPPPVRSKRYADPGPPPPHDECTSEAAHTWIEWWALKVRWGLGMPIIEMPNAVLPCASNSPLPPDPSSLDAAPSTQGSAPFIPPVTAAAPDHRRTLAHGYPGMLLGRTLPRATESPGAHAGTAGPPHRPVKRQAPAPTQPGPSMSPTPMPAPDPQEPPGVYNGRSIFDLNLGATTPAEKLIIIQNQLDIQYGLFLAAPIITTLLFLANLSVTLCPKWWRRRRRQFENLAFVQSIIEFGHRYGRTSFPAFVHPDICLGTAEQINAFRNAINCYSVVIRFKVLRMANFATEGSGVRSCRSGGKERDITVFALRAKSDAVANAFLYRIRERGMLQAHDNDNAPCSNLAFPVPVVALDHAVAMLARTVFHMDWLGNLITGIAPDQFAQESVTLTPLLPSSQEWFRYQAGSFVQLAPLSMYICTGDRVCAHIMLPHAVADRVTSSEVHDALTTAGLKDHPQGCNCTQCVAVTGLATVTEVIDKKVDLNAHLPRGDLPVPSAFTPKGDLDFPDFHYLNKEKKESAKIGSHKNVINALLNLEQPSPNYMEGRGHRGMMIDGQEAIEM